MKNEDTSIKESHAKFFNQVASVYDRVGPRIFLHFGRRLAELAQLPNNAKVLDAAVGRGAVLFPIANQLGTDGKVVGIDLSSEMVLETVREIQSSGVRNAEVYEMDAEELSFADASFDALLCGFSIFFFSRLPQTLDGFHRVLKPRGKIGFTSFSENCEYFDWLHELLRTYDSEYDQQAQALKVSAQFGTSAGLTAILESSGFDNIQIIKEDSDFIYKNEKELWASLWSHGARRILENMEPSVQEGFREHLFQQAQVFKYADGIRIPPLNVLFAFGIK